MLDLLTQEVVHALGLLLAGLMASAFVMLVKSINTYLHTHVSGENLTFLKGMASTIVRYVEQSDAFHQVKLQGSEKKQKALMLFSEYCTENAIPLDYDFMDRLIEEAVNLMNGMVQSER
nr:hypothetical protein [Anaerolineae bacterium]